MMSMLADAEGMERGEGLRVDDLSVGVLFVECFMSLACGYGVRL